MTQDYRATPEQWDALEKCSHAWPGAWGPCILELRARVEALEKDAQENSDSTHFVFDAIIKRLEALEANSKPTPNSSQVGSSLVERVSTAIALEDEKHYWPSTEGDARDVVESDMARAAIREVALWLNEAPLDLYPGDRGIVVNALYDQANQ